MRGPPLRPCRKSELVVIDHGAILRDYCSDMTRTVFLGRAPQKVRRMYRAVLEAQEAAKQAIRPGVTAGKWIRRLAGFLSQHELARLFYPQHGPRFGA